MTGLLQAAKIKTVAASGDWRNVITPLWAWITYWCCPRLVTVLLTLLMTQNYLKYVTVSKSTLWQLSGARLCPDWDLLRTFLCTTRTGSRCTIVQNSVVFLSNFRAFRCFCPHVRPHLRAHKYLNPDKEDYSDVCPAINISTAGILFSTDNTHSTDFSAMHCNWQIQNV